MAHPSALGAPGRVNGLTRGRTIRKLPFDNIRVMSRAHLPFVALGSGLYLIALLFPLALKQVTPAIVLAALVGTGLLLFGLHLQWTKGSRR